MSTTTLTFQGRLPGVETTAAVAAPAQPLRLDVAAFVGFARSGPVDLPVAVEDLNQFGAVFGDDLVLATDAGEPVYAQLPGAVRSFFDNGGRRCYVVRVAGPAARAARWEVPGMRMWQPDGTVGTALLDAAWPGAWSAGAELSTGLLVVPLGATGAYQRATGTAPGLLPLGAGGAAGIQPGDLIRLALAAPDDPPLVYGRVRDIDGGTLRFDVELPYRPGDGTVADHPDPGALAGRPAVLPVASAALLRLDLTVRQFRPDGARLLDRWTDLAFTADPGGGTGSAGGAGTAQPRPAWFAVVQPAGDATPDPTRSMVLRAEPGTVAAATTGLVVPVGMDLSGVLPAAGSSSTVDGSDDLGTFPAGAFVDTRLAGSTIYSLLPDAAALTGLADLPTPLAGLHGLLDIDEVALVALPDATQVGWSAAADPADPPVAADPAGYDESGLVDVQRALVVLCAARGDAVALLSLPAHYDPARTLAWRDRLTGDPALTGGSASGTSPVSYAGYWYPWLRVPDPAGLAPLRAVPPDGAVAGTIAARELARGAWIAPAGLPLRGPVQTVPALTGADTARLFNAGANLLRPVPGAISALSAHTLSTDPALLQLSVRRLLILVRKTALTQGQRYTFQTDNDQFRQLVRMRFERILGVLADGGALAAFQVVAEDGDVAGSVVVRLRIAPSNPIEFITISLVRSGEGLLDVLES